MKLDELDVHILKKVQENARVSFSEIAGELSVSEGTIFSRIKKLEENDIIRGYKAKLNRRQLGELITAIVGLEIEGKKISEVAEGLEKINYIKYLYITHGIYNAIAVIHAKNLDHLRLLTNDNIAKIDGVRRMQVLIALDIMRENLSVDLDRFNKARGLKKITVKTKKKMTEKVKKQNIPDELDIYIYKTESPPFDEIDLHILRLLQKDSRASLKEIAKKTKVSEGTIYVRIKKLIEKNIIDGFYADLNSKMLEENISAFIGININRREFNQEALLAKAREGHIKSIYIVSGVFDGVLYVKARSLKELNDFVWNELALMDGIKNNQTFINLKTIKEDYDVVL